MEKEREDILRSRRAEEWREEAKDTGYEEVRIVVGRLTMSKAATHFPGAEMAKRPQGVAYAMG